MLLMTGIQLRGLSESVWEEPSKPKAQQTPAQGVLVDRILTWNKHAHTWRRELSKALRPFGLVCIFALMPSAQLMRSLEEIQAISRVPKNMTGMEVWLGLCTPSILTSHAFPFMTCACKSTM
jgi:hypothetical protein